MTSGELLEPHRTARQRQGAEGTHWPMSAVKPVGAAVLINQLGQGTVLTFAALPISRRPANTRSSKHGSLAMRSGCSTQRRACRSQRPPMSKPS